MILARVIGNATCACAHSSLKGVRLLVCEVTDNAGQGTGKIIGAVDWLGAGTGSLVLINADGDAVASRLGRTDAPLRDMVVGLVDHAGGIET